MEETVLLDDLVLVKIYQNLKLVNLIKLEVLCKTSAKICMAAYLKQNTSLSISCSEKHGTSTACWQSFRISSADFVEKMAKTRGIYDDGPLRKEDHQKSLPINSVLERFKKLHELKIELPRSALG